MLTGLVHSEDQWEETLEMPFDTVPVHGQVFPGGVSCVSIFMSQPSAYPQPSGSLQTTSITFTKDVSVSAEVRS